MATRRLPLFLLVWGCDVAEPEPEPEPLSNFSIVDLRGGVAGEFRGGAYFAMQGSQFRLYLYAGREADLDVRVGEYVAIFASGLPEERVYTVVHPDTNATLNAGYSRTTPNALFVEGAEGTVEFTKVSPTRVTGVFTFGGTAYVPGQTGIGLLTGSFQARPATIELPPYSFEIPEE